MISQGQPSEVAGGNTRPRFEKWGVRRISRSVCFCRLPVRNPLAEITAEVCFPSTEKEIKALLLQLANEQNNPSYGRSEGKSEQKNSIFLQKNCANITLSEKIKRENMTEQQSLIR